jgi:two-component system OmpR family sensor kinase
VTGPNVAQPIPAVPPPASRSAAGPSTAIPKGARPTASIPSTQLPAGRQRSTLAVRVTLLVIVVAVLVAVVASVVGVLVLRRTLLDVTTEALSDRADVIAAQIAAGAQPADDVLAATATVLAAQGISVVSIGPKGRLTGADKAVKAARSAGANDAVDGRSVSGTAQVAGSLQLIEARSTAGSGFALVAAADIAAANRQVLERRLLWAIAAGLVAAVLVGLLVARVVSGPLRRTAGMARAMGSGARDLRAPVAGPREVADVSIAVNELADALQHSESRQRNFLASVSHELRTPLAGINGQAQALADGLVPFDEQESVGRSIVGEAARLDRLVSDLLDLARLGADSFTLDIAPTDLGALISDMSQVWQLRCAGRGVRLLVELPPGGSGPLPLVVETDSRRVRQVLDGLAENALRLLAPGQPLVLHLGLDGFDAVLQVRDGGPGLAAADYPVAFLPGVLHARYRNRRPTGAGLGLALAHSLVDRLGGTIVASPATEGGVAFTVRLPRPR